MREYVRFSENKIIHKCIAELLDLLETTLLLMFCCVLVFTYLLRIATVQGSSMESTLESGDRILVSTLFYRPSCGDIVIIDAQEAVLLQEDGTPYAEEGLDKSIVKRIIAVGGQTIDIDPETGAVLVDGVVQEEPYISADTFIPSGGGAFTYPVEIPDGYVFVMGDNREVSKDSRYADVGLVAVSEIDGEVLFRLSPWESIGFVN